MGLQSWRSIGTHYETQNVEIRCNLDIPILCSFYILSCLLSIPSSSTLLILLGFGWLYFLVNVNLTFQIHYYSPFTPNFSKPGLLLCIITLLHLYTFKLFATQHCIRRKVSTSGVSSGLEPPPGLCFGTFGHIPCSGQFHL